MEALPEGEIPTLDEIKRCYNLIDKDESDDITWSEFQVALAYLSQLNEKNLQKVFKFLNPKNRQVIKLKHLHSTLKPHIFRLKLKHGTERDTLERIIANLGQMMAPTISKDAKKGVTSKEGSLPAAADRNGASEGAAGQDLEFSGRARTFSGVDQKLVKLEDVAINPELIVGATTLVNSLDANVSEDHS